eukprot:gnl/MRDRNA2_/MRDRNA2_123578_c0_seq1.p1 gnl/MRDRNA2_/MRDRNA2_123578_c0~~gnl/MRDRNA2_/MRDRNA2_123578_c0_seq1.p1  ORF type:complete len:243 (+),score=46.32 gnl/MRDRNA2_/MRDRNA2_123578_c0_seq1:153-881(+)
MGNVPSVTMLCQPCEDGRFDGCCREDEDELARKIDELDLELHDIKQQNNYFRKENMKLQQQLQHGHSIGIASRDMGLAERVPVESTSESLNMTRSVSYGLPTPRTLNSFAEVSSLHAARQSFNAMLGLGTPSTVQEDVSIPGPVLSIPDPVEDQYLLPDPPRVSPSYQQGDTLSKTMPASSTVHAQLLQLKRENEDLKQRQVQYDTLSMSAPGSERDLQIRVEQLSRENDFLKKKIRSLAHL